MENHDVLNELKSCVKRNFADSLESRTLYKNGSTFVEIRYKLFKLENMLMKYLPLFYIIGSVEENKNLLLKLITHRGQVVQELMISGGDRNAAKFDANEAINFLSQLKHVRFCQGIKSSLSKRKFDIVTFSSIYIVELLEQNIYIRSRQCKNAVVDGGDASICDECIKANSKEDASDSDPSGSDQDKPVKLVYQHHLTGTNAQKDLADTLLSYQDVESSQNLFSPFSSIPNHQMVEGSQSIMHKCSFCSFQTHNEVSFQKHIKDIHCKVKEYQCGNCSQVNILSNNLKTSDPTEVPLETLKESHTNSITQHSLSVNQYSEPENMNFNPPPILGPTKDEVNQLSDDKQNHNALDITTNDNHDKTIKCEECSFTATKNLTFLRHVKFVHRETFKSSSDEKGEDYQSTTEGYVCKICDNKFVEEKEITIHMKEHEAKPNAKSSDHKFMCDVCPFTTNKNTNLRLHIGRIHKKDKKFKCEECIKEFTIKSEFMKHMQKNHKKEVANDEDNSAITKPHPCSLCDKSYSQKSALSVHMKSAHNDHVKASLSCQSCPFVTNTKNEIKDHVLSVHEQIKRFKCTQCEYSHYDRGDVLEHIKKAHKDDEYKCPYCSFTAEGKSKHKKKRISDHVNAFHSEMKIGDSNHNKLAVSSLLSDEPIPLPHRANFDDIGQTVFSDSSAPAELFIAVPAPDKKKQLILRPVKQKEDETNHDQEDIALEDAIKQHCSSTEDENNFSMQLSNDNMFPPLKVPGYDELSVACASIMMDING